ncbi:hypothetical protein Agub_g4731, partial [Astrephomene gubernaculifera]
DEDYEAEGVNPKRARRAISPAVPAAGPTARPPPRNTRLPADKLPTGIADLPQQLNVSCNDVAGTFIMDGIKVLCHCKDCVDAPRSAREFHPTHWEQHCGAGTAKKWKASIKIEPGGAPEVPAGGNPMQIGKWFDMLGVEFRPAKTTGGPPVLEFTGATIRRMEAEVAGGPAPPSYPPPYQPAPPPASHQPTPPPSQPPAPPLPQRSGRPSQPTPPLRSSSGGLATSQGGGGGMLPLPGAGMGGGGGSASAGGGSGSRRTEDGGGVVVGGGAGSSKPPRPVSDGDGEGDGDADYCPSTAPTGPPSAPRRVAEGFVGGPRDGGAGEEGESSSRGSASDTLGPHATA